VRFSEEPFTTGGKSQCGSTTSRQLPVGGDSVHWPSRPIPQDPPVRGRKIVKPQMPDQEAGRMDKTGEEERSSRKKSGEGIIFKGYVDTWAVN